MLSESIAVTGGDQYAEVDQVRLYAVPYSMEWLVCQKSFFGLFAARLQVLYFATCKLQNPGAECDSMRHCGYGGLFGAGMEMDEIFKRRDGA